MDQRLAARGLAVLLSMHDPDDAFSIANRVVLSLADGSSPRVRRPRC
jgi:hypothetical protein